MKGNIVKILIAIPFIFLWVLCLYEFGSDIFFLINAKKTTGVITNIKYETHKQTCDYTEYPAGCGEYTSKYAYVTYTIKGKQYNSKLYLGSQGDTSKLYIHSKAGDNISFYYNNINKNRILLDINTLYIGSVITILIFLLPFIIIIFIKSKKKVDKLDIKKDIDYNNLIIHKYDDNYAVDNKTSGVKELMIATIVGISYVFVVVIWALLEMKYVPIFILITIVFIIIIVVNIRKSGMSNIASMSVIIEDNNDLYYLSVMPNLQGSSLPSSISALIAGKNAIYVENKLNAEVISSNLAQSNEVVISLFESYVNNKIKYSVMYGWPIKVAKFTKNDLIKESNKQKVYKCVWQDKKIGKIYIPKCFPTFWN